ncbi:ribosome biogenesis GTP-binding protein YihA/YsxC [Rhabdochromatium marinum]|uniref:ribosome biogenesis GTP-binding protein YihA/YsxC n=1 Tax=Rhabdochromatium marinum TaxID=48729 RepID=UPI001903B021|nr:ribosome biogenesis GTP-binding protein YihA/YsxC [Rhabdochromatium marinum]MBK1648650.1 YihA family ribosome biogenesis GTP-binding protein [Rhabdochromatium marinum]
MNPVFQRAHFLSAASGLDHAPTDQGAEVAFAGRSNAGKSSALNALCHQNRLARTSKTPGRTQQLVFFQLNDAHRLVDLPGYGFAKVSVAIKAGWQQLMANYLAERQSLRGLVVLMDIRHPLTEVDRQMLAWGQDAELPLLILLTKADKLKRGAIDKTLHQVRRELTGLPDGSALLAFSALRAIGIEAAQAWVSGQLALHSSSLAHNHSPT